MSIPGFLPVARYLLSTFGAQLESLAVLDIPRSGVRPPSEGQLDAWFPVKLPLMSCLRELHLAGVPYSPAFFESLLGKAASQLRELTIEDFDSETGSQLLACLAVPALQGLRALRVAQVGRWKEEERVVESWAGERGCGLEASWLMRRVVRWRW